MRLEDTSFSPLVSFPRKGKKKTSVVRVAGQGDGRDGRRWEGEKKCCKVGSRRRQPWRFSRTSANQSGTVPLIQNICCNDDYEEEEEEEQGVARLVPNCAVDMMSG